MTTKFPCPCCGYKTLREQPPGTFAICPVCFWEDDAAQFRDRTLAGGANGVSLEEARANYRTFGASQREFLSRVRRPTDDEADSG
jgi:hypothetical protein